MSSFAIYVRSSVGSKHIMAISGAALVGFALVHMVGNLLVFRGPDALNAYGVTLRHLGTLLWVLRGGILFAAFAHIATGIQLTLHNRTARPIPYAVFRPKRTTPWARSMVFSGLMLLAFIVYHLLHLTFGVILPEAATHVDAAQRHDIYAMVITGFRNPAIAGSYVVAMAMLAMHLAHGGSSLFQSLGVSHPNCDKILEKVGPVIAIVLLVGNCSMPIAVYLGLIPGEGGVP